MNDITSELADKITADGEYETLSEQLERESLRYSRALPEEEEARLR